MDEDNGEEGEEEESEEDDDDSSDEEESPPKKTKKPSTPVPQPKKSKENSRPERLLLHHELPRRVRDPRHERRRQLHGQTRQEPEHGGPPWRQGLRAGLCGLPAGANPYSPGVHDARLRLGRQ